MKYPAYQINIPAAVRFDENLPANAKLLYGEIKALCDQQGYCWAGNNHLAFLYGVKAKVVSRWINQLSRQGYLQTVVSQGNQRKIFINSDPPKKELSPPSAVEGINQKVDSGLPNDRSVRSLHLINNIIDYNDRINSVSIQDSSIKKWRDQSGEKSNRNRMAPVKLKGETYNSPPVAPSPPHGKKEFTQKFLKPSVEQVEEYMQSQDELCPDKSMAKGQALRFVNYYEANGWKVGRNYMKDWQAAANNWLLNAKDYGTRSNRLSKNDVSSPNFDPYATRLHSGRHSGGAAKDYSIPL